MRRTFVHAITLLLGCTLAMGCSGAEGPAGPVGPEGPAGPPGPSGATRTTYFVTIDSSGYAEQALPFAFGTNPANPPLLACFIAEVRTEGLWQPVGDGFTTEGRGVCALVFDEGRWFAVIVNSPPGWTVAFMVIGG